MLFSLPVVHELVSKVFVPISGSIILNRTFSTWVDKNYTDNDDVTSGHLGLGCNLTTVQEKYCDVSQSNRRVVCHYFSQMVNQLVHYR